tara:strand:- start:2938 stop:3129 length:192 start_codon:yes stop_codon:yes gene_type:complete
MQLRLKSRYDRNSSGIKKGFVIKTILFILAFFLLIFLLDKIDMPVPNKLIKQKISNDKLITVK